jgi:hypothetical protein
MRYSAGMPEFSKVIAKRVGQYRVCGTHPDRGNWYGEWRDWPLDEEKEARIRYDARDYLKRSTDVRIEFREITITETTREDVK